MAYKRFKATNQVTGEVLRGRAEELAEKIGVTTKTFRNAGLTTVRLKGVWEVESIEASERQYARNYPRELLEMWDAVTEPFKALSRELRGNTPNLVEE